MLRVADCWSPPQPVTVNGVADSRSNWLAITPHNLQGSTSWSPFAHACWIRITSEDSRIDPRTLGTLHHFTAYAATQGMSGRAIEMTADIEDCSELPMGATPATRTRSGTCHQEASVATIHGREVKGCNTKTVLVVEPNHSWSWPFKSPTNRKQVWHYSSVIRDANGCSTIFY